MTTTITSPDTATSPSTTPELPAGTVEIDAGSLIEILSALLPCASADPEVPVLAALRLEAGNGRLSGMATDRYVLAHASKTARGSFAADAMLTSSDGQRFLTDLTGLDSNELVRLVDETHPAGQQLTLHTSRGTVGSSTYNTEYIYPAAIRELLTVDGYERVGVEGPVEFSPHNLALIRACTKVAGERVARIYFRPERKAPLRVEVSDWFVLMIMPIVRGQGYEPLPPRPTIAAGLPEQPITVDATADEPTDISWPRTVAEATPRRIARHYAANVQHLHRRTFDEPFPRNLPPYAKQDPVQRRIAAARSDLTMSLVDSYAVALLMRAFAAAAPAAALEAARDLWEGISFGDSIGEQVYDWLKHDDIDPAELVTDDVADERDRRAEEVLRRALAVQPPRVDPFVAAKDDEEKAAHVVEIEGPDASGHWSWRCTQGEAEASGLEPHELMAAAQAHGPLAAGQSAALGELQRVLAEEQDGAEQASAEEGGTADA